MRTQRIRLGVLVSTAALFIGVAVPSADAAPRQEGLVNVNVSDVIVQAPIGIAANICNTTVNALATAPSVGATECDAEAGPDGVVAYGRDGSSPRQEGLVNVNVSDLIVQLPISVAANVCDTTVNVLSFAPEIEGVVCTAEADPGDVIAWGRRGHRA